MESRETAMEAKKTEMVFGRVVDSHSPEFRGANRDANRDQTEMQTEIKFATPHRLPHLERTNTHNGFGGLRSFGDVVWW